MAGAGQHPLSQQRGEEGASEGQGPRELSREDINVSTVIEIVDKAYIEYLEFRVRVCIHQV